MLLGIDHLVVSVPDPDAAVGRLGEALGIAPGGGGRHESLGTFNRLLWLGDSFVELIGVFDRTLATGSWIGAPTVRSIDRGGGLATWALATDDIEGDVQGVRAGGSDLSDPVGGERQRPDGQVVRWRLATPPRLDPHASPFLIEHDRTAAEWTPSDRASRAASPGRLQGIELAVPDLDLTSTRFTRTLGLEWQRRSASIHYEIRIGQQFARLRAGDAAGPAAVYLSVDDSDTTSFDLLGCRWIVNG